MRVTLCSALLLSGALIGGCTTDVYQLQSRYYPPSTNLEPPNCPPFNTTETKSAGGSNDNANAQGADKEGILYYLPRQRLKLTLIRTKLDKTDIAKSLRDAQKNLVTLRTATETLELEFKLQTTILSKLAATSSKYDEQALKVAQSAAAYEDAKGRLVSATNDVALLESKLIEATKGAEFDNSVALSLMPLEPDPSAAYMAKLEDLNWHDNKVTVTTTPEGLLTTGDGKATSRAVDVLVEVVRAAGSAVKIVSGGPRSQREMMTLNAPPPMDRKDCPGALREERTFLPSAGELDAINVFLDRSCVPIQLKIDQPHEQQAAAPGVSYRGLLYRRAEPIDIKVLTYASVDSMKGAPLDTRIVTVSIPNYARVAYVPMKAGAFATTETTITFINGMLTSADFTQPSEALAAAQIPGRMLSEIVNLPAEIIKLRVDYSSQEAKELQNQKAILDAQKQLIDAQAALDAARANAEADAAFGQ